MVALILQLNSHIAKPTHYVTWLSSGSSLYYTLLIGITEEPTIAGDDSLHRRTGLSGLGLLFFAQFWPLCNQILPSSILIFIGAKHQPKARRTTRCHWLIRTSFQGVWPIGIIDLLHFSRFSGIYILFLLKRSETYLLRNISHKPSGRVVFSTRDAAFTVALIGLSRLCGLL